MLQLRQLRTFLAAAETLNFTKAAERVHLTQPSVTEQIRGLEEALGKVLFDRANNRLALTAAGHNLAGRARELLAMADATVAAVRDDATAQAEAIRVAAPQTLCTRLIAPLVASCAEEGVTGRVSLLERNSRDTEQSVLEGSADIGLLHGWPRSGGDMEAEAIARDAPVVLLAAGHPLAAGVDVESRALASYPLLLTPPGCRYRDYAELLLQEGAVRPRIRAEADGASSLARLVASGAGVAVLPRLAAEAGAADLRVELRPLRGAGAGLPICLVRAARGRARPAVEAFMGLLRAAAAGLGEAVAALDVQHLARGVAVSK